MTTKIPASWGIPTIHGSQTAHDDTHSMPVAAPSELLGNAPIEQPSSGYEEAVVPDGSRWNRKRRMNWQASSVIVFCWAAPESVLMRQMASPEPPADFQPVPAFLRCVRHFQRRVRTFAFSNCGMVVRSR